MSHFTPEDLDEMTYEEELDSRDRAEEKKVDTTDDRSSNEQL